MRASTSDAETAEQFTRVAAEFRKVVENAPSLERAEFLKRIYPILPRLIDQAIAFPDVGTTDDAVDEDEERNLGGNVLQKDVARSHDEWKQLYSSLSEVLGEWDSYSEVFDPVHNREIAHGSLADDLADIYRDVSEAVDENSTLPQERIWNWRFSFRTHWGHHAISALRAIHARLNA